VRGVIAEDRRVSGLGKELSNELAKPKQYYDGIYADRGIFALHTDPRYGGMEDFERLLAEAHARSLRLIIDLVVNHTSNEHPWFKAACSDKADPKRDYYIWKDSAPDGGPPNNWGALFGGPAWTLDGKSGQYYLHLFSSRQPELNWANPLLRREIFAMMRRWLERGVDGFRMDVISLIAKPDDFSDGPVGPSGYFDPRERVAINADEQSGRKDSVLNFYKELIRLRHAYPVVVYGEFIPYASDDPNVFAYLRVLGGEALFVCCNFTARFLTFAPPDGFLDERARLLMTNHATGSYMTDSRLAPYEAVVILKEES
jgi:glycosidase